MKKLRWGVIGAGGIADRRTIPGMMLAKNAELSAVMDINAEQVEKIRQKYGAKRGGKLALFSWKLSFPYQGQELSFCLPAAQLPPEAAVFV